MDFSMTRKYFEGSSIPFRSRDVSCFGVICAHFDVSALIVARITQSTNGRATSHMQFDDMISQCCRVQHRRVFQSSVQQYSTVHQRGVQYSSK